jgi:hypothetical protein
MPSEAQSHCGSKFYCGSCENECYLYLTIVAFQGLVHGQVGGGCQTLDLAIFARLELQNLESLF